MNCASIQPMLSAWMDQELSADGRLQVEQHLAACEACRAQLAEMQKLDADLRGMLQPSRSSSQALIDAMLAAAQRLPLRAKPRPWRQAALIIASAAAGFLLALALNEMSIWRGPVSSKIEVSSKQTELDMPVQLALAIGTVELEENGVWMPLPTGAKLKAGQRIRTLPRSRCELSCSDGSIIRLNNESDLIVHSPRQLHLQRGQIWSTVASAPTPFQIKTNQSTVTALGTQFDLQYQEQRTTLTVLEGKTRLEVSGKTADVNAGQQLLLENKAGTYDIREPDYAMYQATNWVHEILVLKGRDNPELTRRLNDLLANIGETKMIYLAEEEIRTLGDHCVVPLCRFLDSSRYKKHGERRQLAARIVADLAQPRSINDLIELLTDADPQVRASMARGLLRLTRQDLGMSLQQWQNADEQTRKNAQARWKSWWSKNQNRYPLA